MKEHFKHVNEPVYLIVNADDYGYFACVSRGILEGGKNGLITATGVIANSRNFSEQIQWLKTAAYLDTGVHLNLSYGKPLTGQMERRLAKWKGKFPGKFSLVLGLLTRQLSVRDVLEEWHAQILRCVDAGLKIHFLNTHEHLHTFPALFEAILELKIEYKIPYLRFPEPEWNAWGGPGSMVRNTLLQCMHVVSRTKVPEETPRLLGMSGSGKLSLTYLQKILASLKRGNVYELMCHPGYFDPAEIGDSQLRSYHHWEQELDLLKSREVRDLVHSNGIRVIRYSDLKEKASDGK